MIQTDRWLKLILLLLILVSTWGISQSSALAATVSTIDGKKVLLEIDEDESVEKGTELVVRTKNQKIKAVLKVKSVRRYRVVAEAIKGRVKVGDVARSESEDGASSGDDGFTPESIGLWSVTGGLSSDSHSVTLSSSAKVAMQGTSYFVRASRIMWPGRLKPLFLEGGVALESLRTSGSIDSAACRGSKDCVLEIAAATPFMRAGWVAMKLHPVQFQLKGGADVMIPISSVSNVIDIKSGGALVFVTGGVSAVFALEDDEGIPVTFEVSTNPFTGATKFTRFMISMGLVFP